ncbi:MAG: hypothetical protein V8R91_03650 [Butyricimonas faecihominis]
MTDTILGYKNRDWAYHVLKDERVLQFPDLMKIGSLIIRGTAGAIQFKWKADRNFYISQWFDEDDSEWGEKFSRAC